MKSQQDYNAGIYVRLSKDDERAGESVSIENQKLILTKHAQEQGWNVVETYCDDGYSGTNFDRPGVTRLIDDAKDGKINLILVKDLSRFGRNYIQVGQFTDYLFPMIGCRFIALNNGVDTANNDSSNDLMPFLNLFNEFQSRDASKKIKAVKKACASNGMYLGCYAPFGYKKSPDDKHKFIIDETAATVVRKIFDYRCQGYGYYKIAGFLNAEKLPTPRDYYQQLGKPNPYYSNHMWNDVTMKTIIRNEVYIGNMVQNKTGSLSYKNSKQITKPKEDWIRVEGTHEPIIDIETWNLCVELDKRNNKKPRTTGEGNLTLFSGLVQCIDCGFKMRSNREKKVYPKAGIVVYTSYMCGNYARSGKGVCSAHIIYEKVLVELLIEDIRLHAKRVIDDENSVRRDLIQQRNSEPNSSGKRTRHR